MTEAEQQALEGEIAVHLAARQQDRAATSMVRGYGPQVLGYLVALVRDHDAASEIFAQASEELWRTLDGFRLECSARTWFYLLAWRAARRWQRQPFRRRGQRLDTSRAAELVDAVRTTTAAFKRTNVKDRLAALRAQLDPEDRTLLILRRLDRELEWDDVARILSSPRRPVTAAALRKRFERIKDELREHARRAGLLGGDA